MAMTRVTGGNRDPLTKRVLHDRLREWSKTSEKRIDGGTASDNRARWIYIRDGNHLYNIHADTIQEGVRHYLDLVGQIW